MLLNAVSRFVGGCAFGLALFAVATCAHAHLASSCGLLSVLSFVHCPDGIKRVGFPLVIWEEGGFAYHSMFSVAALAFDLCVAGCAALLAGVVARRIGQGRNVYQ